MSFLGSLSDRELEERRPVPHFRPSCLISDDGLTPEEKADLDYAFANYAAIVMWHLSPIRPTKESPK